MRKNIRVGAFPLAAGLLIGALGCRDDLQSPNVDESSPATSSAEPSLAVTATSNTWAARPVMPQFRENFGAGTVANASGQWVVYVLGGTNSNGDTGVPGLSYNVATNTWGIVPNAFTNTSSMNGVARISDKLYFTGGESSGDVDFRTFNTTFSYRPSTQTLSQRANMPHATKYGVSGVLNEQLYVLPGYCSGESVDPGHCTTGGFIRQLYRYDPASNTWTTRQQAPHVHALGAAAVINNKLYVVGNSHGDRSLDVYDPASNTWQSRASIPTGGEQLFGVALGSKFFVLTYTHGNPAVTKAYTYSPSTNTWTSRAAPPNHTAGPLVKVTLNGQSKLFLPSPTGSSYLYTP
jgi:N-acetylneuraminic acid mutarotase